MLEWMEQSALSGMLFDHLEMRDHASDFADQHDTQDALDDLPKSPSPPSIAMAVPSMLPPVQPPSIFHSSISFSQSNKLLQCQQAHEDRGSEAY